MELLLQLLELTSSADTFTLPASGLTVDVTKAITMSSSQTAFQRVNSTNTTGNTFTINTGEDWTTATLPSLYTNASTPVAITCVVDNTTATKVICTPTSSQMTKNTNYTIQYHKTCEPSTFTSTGLVVGFDLTATDSSFMMNLSKIALGLAIFLF